MRSPAEDSPPTPSPPGEARPGGAARPAEGPHRRLSLGRICRDVIQHVLELDHPLARTLRDLARRPGPMAADYVRGPGRDRYTNPLKFCFAAGAISVALFQIFGAGEFFRQEMLRGAQIAEPGIGGTLAEHIADYAAFTLSYQHVIYFLTLPVLAWLLRLMFLRSPLNIAEHLVFCLYILGALYVLSMPLAPWGYAGNWGVRFYMILSLAYFLWAGCGFYGGRWWLTCLKLLAAGTLYYVFYVIVIGLGGIAYVIVAHRW